MQRSRLDAIDLLRTCAVKIFCAPQTELSTPWSDHLFSTSEYSGPRTHNGSAALGNTFGADVTRTHGYEMLCYHFHLGNCFDAKEPTTVFD